MKITRIAAVSIILAGGALSGLQAQTIAPAARPAEYPPTTYTGRQYVDSKGCVFIRAGFDGNVTWVPRVNRARQQLCGAQPSNVSGATRANPDSGPDIITLAPDDQPAAQAAAPRVVTAPASTSAPARAQAAAAAPAKPQRTPASTSTGAAAVAVPVRPVQPVPQVAKPARSPAPVYKPVPAAPSAPGRCPGASALSQQYINKGPDVRCGPQKEDPLSSLTPNSRILPLHVYRERQLSADVIVPAGYRPVWEDDRLNPRRAERTPREAVISPRVDVPAGYTLVDRGDNRFNPMRGVRTEAGDVQMAQVWGKRLPLQPVAQPLDKTPFLLRDAEARIAGQTYAAQGVQDASGDGMVMRLSTRSAPDADLPQDAPLRQRYVRAATFADRAEAAAVADALSGATGLAMVIGKVNRNGTVFHVVLSGPFTLGADQALNRVRAAGYGGARLSN